jgi:hypothetical protein
MKRIGGSNNMPVGASIIMGDINAAQHKAQANHGQGPASIFDRARGIRPGQLRDRDQVICDLLAENAALLDLLSAERAENDDLRLALELLAEPMIAGIALRGRAPARTPAPAREDTCACDGFADAGALNI